MRKPNDRASRVRLANACVAAVLTVAFLGHALLGSLARTVPLPAPPMTVLWALVGIACVHGALSVATTLFMLRDAKRPPSARKKRHQLQKWISGAVLAAAIAVHASAALPQEPARAVASLVLLGALCWHGWAGMKSLSRDLGARSALKAPLRLALCVCGAACAVLVIAGMRRASGL